MGLKGGSVKKILVFLTGLYVAAILTGCETVKGIGKDIENAGSTVQHSLSR